ncbi:MAG: beta-propeller domain-containing protein, partial [Clostridiales bacterium]|nr:beta-propeller domain-containing protein [Clostridiales bacterium]
MKKKIRVCVALLLVIALAVSVALALTACGNGGGDSSGTNVQEEGVDEADVVKVNGDGYIFKAQTDGVTVSRLNADGAVEVVRKSKAGLDFTPREMFLHGDKYLVVIGYKTVVADDEANGYYTRPSYDEMIVRVYDLEASAAGDEVVCLRSDEFRGAYKTSRMIDGKLYLLTNYNSGYDKAYVDFFFGKIKFDVSDGNGNGFLIAGLDLNDARGRYKTGLYAGSVYEVYCSPYALYALRSKRIGRGCNYITATDIDKISLDTLKKVKTVTDLRGYAQDRFCLSDNGETLFAACWVAGTMDVKNADPRGSYLYSFDKDLNRQAKLGPIAPGEQLKSARFDGDTCYIVTYRQVDPLYKIDISDPAAPKITGELKIDGYSAYMQAFGDGLLIGVGYGESGGSLKVTLFQTGAGYPDEVNSLVWEATDSAARTDPRAILCEPDNNLFALPAGTRGYKYYDRNAGAYVNTVKKQGAYVLGIKDGELAELAFLTDLEENFKDSISNGRKTVARIARIGNYLLTISDGDITPYAFVTEGGVPVIDPEPVGRFSTRIVEDVFTVSF